MRFARLIGAALVLCCLAVFVRASSATPQLSPLPPLSSVPPSAPFTLEAKYQAKIATGYKGYAISFISVHLPGIKDWQAAPPPSGLLIRFDGDDPKTENIFNAERNIYDRPQREIALYWNGVEIARRLSIGSLTGEPGDLTDIQLAFVTGGMEVTVTVGKSTTYDHFLIPGAAPYQPEFNLSDPALVVGSHRFGYIGGTWPQNPSPIHVRAIDTMLVTNGNPGGTSWADFPTETERIGRVVATLTLAKTAKGIDPWDRIGNVYVYDDKGERFELLRFITPYRKAYQWNQDVTDLLPLLKGKRRVQIDCTTYSQGWLASVDFTFYPGPAPRHPYKVINLWNTTALIGQTAKPFSGFVPPMTLPIDAHADAARVRLLVTGHGEDPNTDNAAEFISLWRKLSVGGATYQNTLWKEDNYLNPCRPQGGTWKFDRAGWGPGTVVDPWVVDVTKDVHSGSNATFEYTIQPYVNKTPNNGDPARYVIGGQLILYRKSSG